MTTQDQTIADIEAVASIAGTVTVGVIAEVVDLAVEQVVEAVEALEADGRVVSSRTGVTAAESTGRVSESRRAMLAARLQAALESSGAPHQAVAAAAWAAGDAATAHTRWMAAADAGDDGVLHHAVTAGREAGLGRPDLAPLLVRRAQWHRNRGESADAMADLDEATPHLTGEALVDALGFAAVVWDDLQQPSAAERTVAMGMQVAASMGATAKLASLMTLHGRMLVRLGFDREAEDAFDRGTALGETAWQPIQQYFAGLNRAWSDLDRGWAARAEQRYAVARDRAETFEGSVAVADKDIALARARFLTGDARGALDALRRAAKTAEETGAPVLRFLATLAATEGAIAFERGQQALDGAARLRSIVDQDFPSWANRAGAVAARAHLLVGDRDSARTAIESAREATPRGADGHRIRAELDGLELEASDTWDPERAADVADSLLQSGWVLPAVRLLTERSRRESDAGIARTAAALAHRAGAPLVAAAAIEAGGLWSDPAAGPVALAIKRVESSVPEDWAEEWRSVPAISHALETDATVVDDGALREHLESALASVGLGTEETRSPAQRRAAGLVTAGAVARTAGRLIAWLVGMAAVAAVVVLVLQPDAPTVPTTIPQPTTSAPTTTLPLNEQIVPAPDDLGGTHEFGGGEHRNSLVEAQVGEPEGVYWRTDVTGFVEADIVLRGRGVFVGTSQGWSVSLDLLNDGAVIYESRLDGAISGAPTVAAVDFGQDDQDRVLAFIHDDEGNLLVRPINDSQPVVWESNVGSPITGPPLVRTTSVVFATRNGLLLDLYPADGTEQRRLEEPAGFEGPLASADGVIYARTADGQVILYDEAQFTEICRVEARLDQAATTPVVADGVWVVGTTGQTVKAFDAGTCRATSVGTYLVGTDVAFDPVVADGLIWMVADSVLLPLDIATGAEPFVSGVGDSISSAPVVTTDLVIVGTAGGELVAIDRSNGEEVWRFEIGARTRQRVAVADGLILVVGDREILAVATPTG